MKKLTSITAALFMATAFCGVCAGCASEINANAGNKNTDPIAPAPIVTSEEHKVILCPGSYHSGSTVTANTVSTGATKLNANDEEAYYVTNAYFATVAAGEALPAAVTTRSQTTFLGWTYAQDGEVVTIATMPATLDDDLYLYAKWKNEGAITVDPVNPDNPDIPDNPDDPTPTGENYVQVGTQKYTLSRNTGNTTREEYWLGGNKITLAKGATISIYMNGQSISYYVEGSSAGIDKPDESLQVSSVTVTVAGEFDIYLHKNTNNWSCEFAGPTSINTGSEIPQGCAPVHITYGNGSITFYLQDSNGRAIGASDLSNYCLYTFNNELFGSWAESATKGVLKSEMTVTGSMTQNGGWIFRWGSGFGSQTSNITGLESGGTYLIKLPANNKGDATVTKLTV